MPNETVTIGGVTADVPQGHQDFRHSAFMVIGVKGQLRLESFMLLFEGITDWHRYNQRRCAEAAQCHFIREVDRIKRKRCGFQSPITHAENQAAQWAKIAEAIK